MLHGCKGFTLIAEGTHLYSYAGKTNAVDPGVTPFNYDGLVLISNDTASGMDDSLLCTFLHM